VFSEMEYPHWMMVAGAWLVVAGPPVGRLEERAGCRLSSAGARFMYQLNPSPIKPKVHSPSANTSCSAIQSHSDEFSPDAARTRS
jgi:hypothetical protein